MQDKQDKIIDTLSFCLYTKDFIIHYEDLEKYARDISNIIEGHRMLLMERFKYTHFYIYHESGFSIEPYAIVEYQGVLYSDCYFNLKKAQGGTCLRITNKLKELVLGAIRAKSDAGGAGIVGIACTEISKGDRALWLLFDDSDAWSLGHENYIEVVEDLSELTEADGYYTL